MPNMFGGDQNHPAYDPETEIGDNEILFYNDLYTVDRNTFLVTVKSVNSCAEYTQNYPIEVQQLIDKMKKE